MGYHSLSAQRWQPDKVKGSNTLIFGHFGQLDNYQIIGSFRTHRWVARRDVRHYQVELKPAFTYDCLFGSLAWQAMGVSLPNANIACSTTRRSCWRFRLDMLAVLWQGFVFQERGFGWFFSRIEKRFMSGHIVGGVLPSFSWFARDRFSNFIIGLSWLFWVVLVFLSFP